jgi:hypothetical protein
VIRVGAQRVASRDPTFVSELNEWSIAGQPRGELCGMVASTNDCPVEVLTMSMSFCGSLPIMMVNVPLAARSFPPDRAGRDLAHGPRIWQHRYNDFRATYRADLLQRGRAALTRDLRGQTNIGIEH